MTRRVVVTGIGIVTPFGDLAQTQAAIAAGRCALAPVQAFDASPFAESRGGECRTFDPKPWFRQPKALKLADRRTRLAVAAAGMAMADAGLANALDVVGRAGDGERRAAERTALGEQRTAASDQRNLGVIIGTSGSDLQTEDCARAVGSPEDGDACDIAYFGARVLRKLNPLWLLVNLANMASAHVAIQLDARGPNSTVTTDWIAGLQAIGEAARWIACDEADVVIAGGADCGVLPFVYASLEQAGILGNGFVPAEGAALFALESLDHAQERGARIYGEVTGTRSSALSTDAPHDAISTAGIELFLGHALAAAAPIALALKLASGEVYDAFAVHATGSLGQTATLRMKTNTEAQNAVIPSVCEGPGWVGGSANARDCVPPTHPGPSHTLGMTALLFPRPSSDATSRHSALRIQHPGVLD
jgi:3-oxoacyl-(acyl-carrier-protein) synthase